MRAQPTSKRPFLGCLFKYRLLPSPWFGQKPPLWRNLLADSVSTRRFFYDQPSRQARLAIAVLSVLLSLPLLQALFSEAAE